MKLLPLLLLLCACSRREEWTVVRDADGRAVKVILPAQWSNVVCGFFVVDGKAVPIVVSK